MDNYARRVWAWEGDCSAVCFGYALDHLVLSPRRAREIGESLIRVADDCLKGAADEGS